MSLESIKCPNCAAPLRQKPGEEPWLCLFCDSLIRVDGEADTRVASLLRRLNSNDMEEIKQMLISGHIQAAAQALEGASGIEREQAAAIIASTRATIPARTIFQQELTRGGMVMVVICLLLVPASLIALGLRLLSPWLALAYLGIGVYGLYKYGRGALNTLHYRTARVAMAKTVKVAKLGTVQSGRVRVLGFLFALEVTPEDEPTFKAHTVVPVLEENVERAKEGAIIQVKYFPGEPESVIFHRG